jgi:hypothetical protein
VISALVLVACVPAFAWVVLTRELSFAGSFGLFGGHWMLGVLMPVAVLSLVSMAHALQQLYGLFEDDAPDEQGYDPHGGDDGPDDMPITGDAHGGSEHDEAGTDPASQDTTAPGQENRRP